MSNHKPQQDEASLTDAKAVIAYLRRHPDFLDKHPELLAEMELTHRCEGATSLIEKQVQTLRSTNQQLAGQLSTLLKVARENDRLSERMHRLTLQLMNAHSLDDVYITLDEGLRSGFDVDAVAVKLFLDPGVAQVNTDHALMQAIILPMNDPRLDGLKTVLSAGKPLCGPLTGEHITYLFGGAGPLASAALVPLNIDTRLLGVLAIGSRDRKRFQPNMGALFLSHLGDIISCAIKPHITLATPG